MKQKVKAPNRLRFRDYFGTTAMSACEGISAALMTSWFMVYLTDYSGIGQYAALLGTTLLLFTRLFDAVNDPLEGWIMDRAKVGKYGKYKPFIILSIFLYVIGVTAMFFIPSGVKNPVVLCIWVVVAYLLYDIGASFYAPNLVIKTLTYKDNERGKLMIGPRLMSMILGMVVASLINIVNAVNASINNLHDAFGIAVLVMMGIMGVISLLGISLVKERYHAPQSEENQAEKVKFTDIFKLLKENAALQTKVLSEVFAGFVWTFLFATALYYIKWAYCVDLTTGAVDEGAYGLYSLISSMMMFLPLILGTVFATPLMKAFKSPLRFHRFNLLLEAIPCGLLFVLQMTGLLSSMPILFFLCLAIAAIAVGLNFIPDETLKIECMDYEIYKNGKDRSALCNACNKFLTKAQSAISAGMVGVILIAIGYEVDAVTGDFLGELTAIPGMLNWFIVVMGLVPFVLGIVAWLILRKYPITDEIRADMKEKLSR